MEPLQVNPADAMARLNMKHSDPDRKWTNGLQLQANEQIQASSISDVEVSWTEMNLLVGNLTMDFTTR